MISLRARASTWDEWTDVTFNGDEELDITNILTAALLRNDWEVEVADEDGEYISAEEEAS